MKPVFVVRNWQNHFENAQSRKIIGPMKWLAQPTKHDGRGYRRVVRLENAAALLGGWWVTLQVAAKMEVHGLLADDDGPLTAADIAIKVGLPEKDIQASLELASSNDIRWLECLDWDEAQSFSANCALLLAESRTTVDESGSKVDASGSKVDASGSTVDASGSTVDASGSTVDASGSTVDGSGSEVDPDKKNGLFPRALPASSTTLPAPSTTVEGSGSTVDEINLQNRTEQDRTEQDRTGENRTGQGTPPPVPQGGPEREKAVGDEVIKAAIIRTCRLGTFKGKDPTRPWGNEAMHGLLDNLPVPESEWKLVEWFHSLAPDPDNLVLSRRRQSEVTLWANWSDEVTRAQTYRRLAGCADNSNSKKKEPVVWREFFRWKYAESPNLFLPDRFSLLPTDQIEEYRRGIEEFSRVRPDLEKKEAHA